MLTEFGHYQVLLCLDKYDMDAIAINKLCKFNLHSRVIRDY